MTKYRCSMEISTRYDLERRGTVYSIFLPDHEAHRLPHSILSRKYPEGGRGLLTMLSEIANFLYTGKVKLDHEIQL